MNAKCKQTTMYKQHVNDVCSQVCHIMADLREWGKTQPFLTMVF